MNERLRRRLLEMQTADTNIREELARSGELSADYHPKMEEIHLKNAGRLKKIIAAHGWPGKKMVGKDGAEAAWLIVQHAVALPDFSRKCLKLLQKAAAEGEAEPWQAAYLEDRINFFEGNPQKYGTQADWNEAGQMQVWQLQNAGDVNEYRAAVGLPPLKTLVWETKETAPENIAWRRARFLDWAKEIGWR